MVAGQRGQHCVLRLRDPRPLLRPGLRRQLAFRTEWLRQRQADHDVELAAGLGPADPFRQVLPLIGMRNGDGHGRRRAQFGAARVDASQHEHRRQPGTDEAKRSSHPDDPPVMPMCRAKTRPDRAVPQPRPDRLRRSRWAHRQHSGSPGVHVARPTGGSGRWVRRCSHCVRATWGPVFSRRGPLCRALRNRRCAGACWRRVQPSRGLIGTR